MTTTKDLLLQSYQRSRKAIIADGTRSEAILASLVELGGDTTVERLRETIKAHRRLTPLHLKPVPGQGGTLTWSTS